MRKIELFDMAGVLRDSFEKFVAENERQRSMEIKYYSERWKAGKQLDEKIKEVNAKYDDLRQRRRDSFLFDFDVAFEKTVSELKGSVLAVDSETAKKLSDLEAFPLSAIEHRILCEKYANSGYWTNRTLQRLADLNHIEVPKDTFDPAADVVIGTIAELRGRVVKFLDSAGSGTYEEHALLHPAQLKKLEDRLVSGRDPGFGPEKKARRILSEIASKQNVFAQTVALRNVLATAPDDVRKYVLIGLEAGWSRILDDAITVSGADKLIDLANKKHVEDMKDARAAVDELREISDEQWLEAAKIFAKHGGAGNDELRPAIEEAYPDRKKLLEILDMVASDGETAQKEDSTPE